MYSQTDAPKKQNMIHNFYRLKALSIRAHNPLLLSNEYKKINTRIKNRKRRFFEQMTGRPVTDLFCIEFQVLFLVITVADMDLGGD